MGRIVAFTRLLSAGLVFCATLAQAQTSNLLSLLASNSNTSDLAGLLAKYPQFTDTLTRLTDITVFAPSNDAFAAYSSTLSKESQQFVQNLLSYHVAKSTIYASAIGATPLFAHTLLGDPTSSQVTRGQVLKARLVDASLEIITGLKNVARVTQADLHFTGGVVHVIDNFLTMPVGASDTALAADLISFIGLADNAPSPRAIANFIDATIFAPSNSAFQDIASVTGNWSPQQIQFITEYHIVNGTTAYSTNLSNTSLTTVVNVPISITVLDDGSVFVNQARVINSDVLFSGGVLHIIDSVLNYDNRSFPDASETGGVVAYSGASSRSTLPFAFGLPAVSTASALRLTDPHVVAFATAATTGGTSSAPTSSSAPSGGAAKGKSTRLSGGVIAGIVIGSLAVVILAVVAILLYIRRKTRQQQLLMWNLSPAGEKSASNPLATNNIIPRTEMPADETAIHEMAHPNPSIPELSAEPPLVDQVPTATRTADAPRLADERLTSTSPAEPPRPAHELSAGEVAK